MTAKEVFTGALKLAGYALLGLLVYALLTPFPWLGYVLGAVWVAFAAREIVKDAVREVLNEELHSLRRQGHANAELLEAAERKISAVLGYILEIRRGN